MRAMELLSVLNYSLGKEKIKFGRAIHATNSLSVSSPEVFLTILAV
jgi:hypothetical protein